MMKILSLLALYALIPTISGRYADHAENQPSRLTPSHLRGAVAVPKNTKQGQAVQDAQPRVLAGSAVKARLDLTFGNDPKGIYFYILDIDSTGKNGDVVLFQPADLVPRAREKRQLDFDMLPGHKYRFVLLAGDGFGGTFVISIPAGNEKRLVLAKGPRRSSSDYQMESHDFSLDKPTGELIDDVKRDTPPSKPTVPATPPSKPLVPETPPSKPLVPGTPPSKPTVPETPPNNQDTEAEGGVGGTGGAAKPPSGRPPAAPSGPLEGRLVITFDDSPMDTYFFILDVDTAGDGNVLENGILYNKGHQVVYVGPAGKPPSPGEEREIAFQMEKDHQYQFVLHSNNGSGFQGKFAITSVDGSGRRNVLSQGPRSQGPFEQQEYNFSP